MKYRKFNIKLILKSNLDSNKVYEHIDELLRKSDIFIRNFEEIDRDSEIKIGD